MISPRLYMKDLWFNVTQRRIRAFPVSILMYHSIGDNKHFFTVTPGVFHWQMEYMKTHDYNVVSLSRVVSDLVEGKSIQKRSVVLTLDDGYEDNLTNALPILQNYQYPATIFISTGHIGLERQVRGIPLRHMNREQLKVLDASGLVDLQPHGVTHRKLADIPLAEAEEEMRSSQRTLEELTGKKRDLFAYPYGSVNPDVMAVAKKFFQAAVSVRRGYVSHSSPLFNLPRQSVDSRVSDSRFRLKI